MPFTEVFAGAGVTDLRAAREWYERFFGRPPDMLPNDREACWKVTGGGWLYIVIDRERAGRGRLTLLVDDLDTVVAELEQRGLATPAIETVPGAVRRLEVADPDGNQIQLGQPIS